MRIERFEKGGFELSLSWFFVKTFGEDFGGDYKLGVFGCQELSLVANFYGPTQSP